MNFFNHKLFLILMLTLCCWNHQLQAEERVIRDSHERVLSRWLADDDDTPFLCQTYEYGEGYVLETFWADFSEVSVVPLIIDDDGFPLDNGIESFSITYSYDQEGNLLDVDLNQENHSFLFSLPPLQSVAQGIYIIGRTIARASGQAIVKQVIELYELLGFDHFMSDIKDNPFLPESYFVFTGCLQEENHCGAVGYGEVNDKVRVTHINGILNGKNMCISTAQMISNFHGGVNVHYHHNSTDGFTWDFLGALSSRFGIVTLTAEHLARSWGQLIEEMGGVNGGGKIIHYAHSLGGSDTYGALKLMSAEEKAMISVTTFGSPKIIPPDGLIGATNFVSQRDVIGLIGYVLGGWNHTTWVGTIVGVPFVDHLICGETYSDLMQALGEDFQKEWGVPVAQ